MTVIAYRQGIMASDSATGVGDMAIGTCRKIVRSSTGFIAGACGDAGEGSRFLEWVLEGGPDFQKHFVPHDHDFGGLFVSPDGTVRRLGLKGAPYIIEAPFHAMGIGREVAMGAMAAGATAERAVEIAIQYMDGCGGPVQMVKLHLAEAVNVKIENCEVVVAGRTIFLGECK